MVVTARDVIIAPSLEKLQQCTKSVLLEVAKELAITVKSSLRKPEVRNVVIEYMVDENMLEEEALSGIVAVECSNEKDLEYQMKLEEMKQNKEIQLVRLQMEQEKEIELAKIQADVKLKELEIIERQKERENKEQSVDNFDLNKNVRLVPAFEEKEIDKFFLHFEKIAINMDWPEDKLSLLLQSVLVGKARDVYSALSVEQISNYQFVKQTILQAYELVPEAYRQKFRHSKKREDQTYVEFAREKENLFTRWCDSLKIGRNFEKLRQLILVEEFKRGVSADLRVYLDEKEVDKISDAAVKADSYALTHRNIFDKFNGHSRNGGYKSGKSHSGSPWVQKVGNETQPSGDVHVLGSEGASVKSSWGSAQVCSSCGSVGHRKADCRSGVCKYCQKSGHTVSNCRALQDKEKGVTCHYCNKVGHVKANCFKFLQKGKSVPSALAVSRPRVRSCVLSRPEVGPSDVDEAKRMSTVDEVVTVSKLSVSSGDNGNSVCEKDVDCHNGDGDKVISDVMEKYLPFVSNGFVALPDEGDAKLQPIRILRDTGACQSMLLDKVLPLSNVSSTGNSVLVQGVELGYVSVPLHNVFLKSDLVTGCVTVGVRPELPVEGIDLILGNDLAGDKVRADPVMCEQPCEGNTDELEREVPDVFPSCAVTRAMTKSLNKDVGNVNDDSNNDDYDNDDVYDLSEMFISPEESPVTNVPDVSQGNVHVVSENSVPVTDISVDDDNVIALCESPSNVSKNRQQLVVEQEKDPEIVKLAKEAMTEEEVEQAPCGYFKRSGILMRKWRPLDASPQDGWRNVYQIVMPKMYRKVLLSLAHDIPLAGHLGVRKTYEKLLQYFYWPGIKKDVVSYCKSCHVCQMVGKPNVKIPVAPLKPIPAFEEPFSRVIIDCVGPLPKTKSGNQYLLTLMCASTRFPEAIPLRNIKAPLIVKALVKFFTMVGLPKIVQSDQGSNFMSGIFRQVMSQLNVEHQSSTAYHPQSQGALERFHQTLKNMFRTFCLEHQRDWDEGVHLLLFAVRESVQESLGFSPFELVFGHTVRGPLKVLQEIFLCDDNQINMLDYVCKFKQRLITAWDVAKCNLSESQCRMKTWYDKKARERSFQVGDKVLALLPMPGQPLQARYSGPFVVEKKVSDVNYVIQTPGRRSKSKLCHINMLKKYIDRNEEMINSVATVVPVCNESAEEINVMYGDVDPINLENSFKLKNSDVLENLSEKLGHLPEAECCKLTSLILGYKDLFKDVPGRTSVVYHDIDVGDAVPIKQHPYRMNPIKSEYLKEELKYMLENDIITPSDSDWSSPCVLVPKPDGSFRFCTDYRKVNAVTKSDTYPLPRVDDLIDKIGNAKYVSKFDLAKGYWQVPLSERAKKVSAFVAPAGLFQYNVMPFGMKNAPATFQRFVNNIVQDLKGCDAYLDDIIIYNDVWEEHLQSIESFFEKLLKLNLTVNLVKCEFCKATVEFLGHVVGQGQVRPVQAKVEAIGNYPPPVNRKELRRFLGIAGYYRRFCNNFASVVEPLTTLLRKSVKFQWTENCQKAFEKIKAILVNSPVLVAPNFDKQFCLYTDACDVGVGAVLMQENCNGVEHPICYFSKKLDKHQRNYSTIEKESLAIILALSHFEVYLGITKYPVKLFTDHSPLTFLSKMKNNNQRITRWVLYLQQFNLDICHVKGKENVIADALSRV